MQITNKLLPYGKHSHGVWGMGDIVENKKYEANLVHIFTKINNRNIHVYHQRAYFMSYG